MRGLWIALRMDAQPAAWAWRHRTTAHHGERCSRAPPSARMPGTTALAMGGSNQSLLLVGALIATQGTVAVPLRSTTTRWSVIFGMTAPGYVGTRGPLGSLIR
jgi:hypothetical protein